MPLDLARLSSVDAFVRAWEARRLPLHLLVCNAGIMAPTSRLQTPDGLEVQFQVNFLSHFLLACRLLGLERGRRLEAATKAGSGSGSGNGRGGQHGAASGSVGDATRVVMVTSLTHRAGPLQWADMQSKESYTPFVAYGLSKIGNIITAKELQRRLDRNCTGPAGPHDAAVAVHPGLVDTDLANGFYKDFGSGWASGSPLQPLAQGAVDGFIRAVAPLMMRTPEQSARWMLHACLAPAPEVAGQYLAMGRVAQADKVTDDLRVCGQLWDVATRLTGHTVHPTLA